MAYTAESARQQLLDQLAVAVDRLAGALTSLTEAYEQADERTAEVLEARVFRPVQTAYARARRTHAEFARRHQLPGVTFAAASPGLPSADPRIHLERAAEAVEQADHIVAEMQDSMLPVEVGDRELRDGLSATRELVARVPAQSRQLVRLIGR